MATDHLLASYRRRRLPIVIVLITVASPAHAATWDLVPSVATRLSAQTNTTLGSFQAQGDAALVVRPRLVANGRGDRLSVTGDLEVLSTTYARGTLPSRVAPQGRIESRWAIVERAFTLEAEGRIVRTTENPFAATPLVDPVEGTVTSRQVRLTPLLDMTLSPRARLFVRSDNIRVGENASTFSLAGSASGGLLGKHVLRYDVEPRPLGFRIEAEKSASRFFDESQPELRIELARVSAGWMLAENLAVGARWGVERNSVINPEQTSRVSGAQFRWAPSERTSLTAFRERRFFGDAWRVEFAHRMPRFAVNLDVGRSVETGLQSIAELPATGNLFGLLDAMFTTRFPDPLERARLVRDYMVRQGLPEQLTGARTLTTQRLSIVTRRGLRLALNGSSSTTAMSIFDLETRDALAEDPLLSNLSLRNNRQRGLAISHSSKLTPLDSVNAGLDVSEIQALQSVSTDRRRQSGFRLAMIRSVGPKTFVTGGLGWQHLSTTIEASGSSKQLFIGLDQSF